MKTLPRIFTCILIPQIFVSELACADDPSSAGHLPRDEWDADQLPADAKKGAVEDGAISSYVAQRKRVWETRSIADYEALFPAQFSRAIDENRKHVKAFLERELLNIEGCHLVEEIPVEDSKLGKAIVKLLKESGDFRLYRARIIISGGGRNEVTMALIKGRLYQLGNY